jgi:hypothetical protein
MNREDAKIAKEAAKSLFSPDEECGWWDCVREMRPP